MIKDVDITKLVKYALHETREKKSDGTRGKFQEINGFVFFIDIRNSTQTFLEQQDRTYLKFAHAFYAGVHKIFRAYKFREDSIKFLGDGILGVYIGNLNKESLYCLAYEVSSKITQTAS